MLRTLYYYLIALLIVIKSERKKNLPNYLVERDGFVYFDLEKLPNKPMNRLLKHNIEKRV